MSTENLDFSETDNAFTDLADEAPAKTASLDIVSINKSYVFTKEECERVIENCVDELWLPSTVIGDSSLHSSKRQKLRGDVEGFPFLNIRDVTKQANDEIYDFNLIGIIDQDYPQVFKYTNKDHYNWHIELNSVAPSRKLTFIINLSDPNQYKGGTIEFLNFDTSEANINEQGFCLIFPSYIPYKINPVQDGEMHIIVGHIHGALFK